MKLNKARIKKSLLLSILTFCCLQACVEDIDLEQNKSVTLNPVLEASLLYLSVPDSLISLAPPPTRIADSLVYEGFNQGFIVDNLQKAELFFQFKNSTAKPMNTEVQFVNGNNQILDSQTFQIPGATVTPEIVSRTVLYPENRKSIITDTQRIVLIAETNSDTPSIIEDAKLEFKFSGKMYLVIE